MLVGALINHQGALRASLKAEYQLDLKEAKATMKPTELGELVVHLPPGCALWRATGGPLALSEEATALQAVDYRLQVLAWQQTEDAKHNRNAPEPPQPPQWSHEKREQDQTVQRRAERYAQRMAGRRRKRSEVH